MGTIKGVTWLNNEATAVRRRSRMRVIGVLAVGALGMTMTEVGRRVTDDTTVWAATTADMGSSANVTAMTGAKAYWSAGYTGKGIDVAVIDTGVSPVHGLNTAGKLIHGPDLSLDAPFSQLRHLDSYGHGTHMAGLIAGNGAASRKGLPDFKGIAPDARIVSLKVAGYTGAVDVTQVIAAINWVVEHKNDNGMNIRVINLSYGTDSAQPYEIDPLAHAVEQAWKAGIVVVAATGNAGYVWKTGTMTNPAYSPNILAVGAADPMGTADLADDVVPLFSSTGSNARRPDLVAPGTSIVSLRVPGSTVDQRWSITGTVAPTLFRGSGSSQAAAIVSGAVALMLQQRPELTPDHVKAVLTKSAVRLAKAFPTSQGAGELDLQAVRLALVNQFNGIPTVVAEASSGTGSIDASRGTARLSFGGVELSGEKDMFNRPLSSAVLAASAANRTSWSGGAWNGTPWTENGWASATAWGGAAWADPLWFGGSWMGGTWTGNTWSGSTWSGSTWSGSTWSGSTWSGSTWSGSTWSGSTWSGSTWSDNTWSSAGWF